MTQQATGSIAVLVGERVGADEHERVTALVLSFTRTLSGERLRSRHLGLLNASNSIRIESVERPSVGLHVITIGAQLARIADDTWAVVSGLRVKLSTLGEELRIGAHTSTEERKPSIQDYARDLARVARGGGVAVSRALARQLHEPALSEFDLDPENDAVLHFPLSIQSRLAAIATVNRFVAQTADGFTDEWGFLKTSLAGVRDISDLVRDRRALVLGSPWIGKSWVAKHLGDLLDKRRETVWEINLGSHEPKWISERQWDRWVESGKQAYVIVDALDEGIDRQLDLRAGLRLLREAGMHAARLHVLVFSRPTHNELAARALGWDEQLPDITWHMQPLDASAAASFLAEPTDDVAVSQARVAHVRRQVQRLAAPGLVRNLLLLRQLARADETANLQMIEQRVLEQLCQPKANELVESTLGDRRRAAARIAAVLQFSGREWIDLRKRTELPDRDEVLGLADVFPAVGGTVSNRGLERAALALATSGLFEWVEGKGHRFTLQFAKEWFAADALHNCPMSLVRRLTVGPRGGVVLTHRQVIERLAAVRGGAAALLTEAALPLAGPQATLLVAEMLDAAAGGIRFWNLQDPATLSALADQAVAGQLLKVLRDSKQSDDRRHLALDIAVHNASAPGWEDLPSAMVELALETTAGLRLRRTAVSFICNNPVGDPVRSRLDPILQESDVGTGDMRADILLAKLRDGSDVLTIAKAAARPDAGHFDQRASLFWAVADHLDETSVRTIIDQRLGLMPPELPSYALDELYGRAFESWLELDWSTHDIPRILAALDHVDDQSVHLQGVIDERCETQQWLRRMLFFPLSGKPRPTFIRLLEEDASWLVEALDDNASAVSEALLKRVHSFAYVLDEADLHRRELYTILERADATLLTRLEQSADKAKLTRARLLARNKHPKQQGDDRIFVGDAVQLVLAAEHTSSNRIQTLGWVLFVGHWRPEHVYGTFDELTSGDQRAVIDALTQAFGITEPTAFPDDPRETHSVFIRYESAAFSAAVVKGSGDWLTPDVVRVWLPSVLFVGDESLGAVVRRCYEFAPRETRAALLAALAAQAKHSESVVLVQDIPNQAWRDDPDLQASVIDIAADPENDAGAAMVLIWALAHRFGRSVARALSKRATWPGGLKVVVDATQAYLGDGAGLGTVLLGLKPHDRLSFLEPLLERHGGPWSVTLTSWRAPELLDLAAWLLQQFPPESDDARRFGHAQPVTERMRFEDLRGRVVSELIGRDDQSSNAACDKLATLAPPVAPWINRVRSAREVDRVLAGVDPVSARLTPRDVMNALELGFSSSLRSANDLFHVIIELLERIASDCAEGNSLVWYKDERAEEAEDGKRKRRTPAEKRLAQYVRTRLKDLLWTRFGGTVHFAAEVNEAYDDRPDLLGFVLTTEPDATQSTVVIEYKWSHDSRLLKDLGKLATRYVVEKSRGHGIYIVGFSGDRSRIDPTALGLRLNQRARTLEAQAVGLQLHVCMLPFLRPTKPATTRRLVGPAQKKSAQRSRSKGTAAPAARSRKSNAAKTKTQAGGPARKTNKTRKRARLPRGAGTI